LRAVAAVLVLVAAPAWAQSKRYPADADPDEDDQRSALWESALHPDEGPYKELVRDARRLLDDGTEDSAKQAVDKLTDAIHRVPTDPEAYVLRGRSYLSHKSWAPCADDLAAADDHTAPDDTTSGAGLDARARLRLDLATCQAHAGRYADAEATLLRAQSTQHLASEVALRLGEVRIALGKLDEAIDALAAASDATPGANGAMLHWLLAEAYDRARRPGEAQAQVEAALRYDRNLTIIEAPPYPWLGVGEREYLFGVAYALPPSEDVAAMRPEYALLYFRRFVQLAPKSPWHRRAEEHVKELSALAFPITVRRDGGSATVDLSVVAAAVRRQMPAMRACLAQLPTSAYGVTITKIGPRTPETVRDRPIYRLPPAGTSVENTLNVSEAPQLQLVKAVDCIQPIAEKLALPAVKDRDAYYKISFTVVE
jgi:tetratricopeptide (TPR) repeat protein